MGLLLIELLDLPAALLRDRRQPGVASAIRCHGRTLLVVIVTENHSPDASFLLDTIP